MGLLTDLLGDGYSGASSDWVEPSVNSSWTVQGAPYEVPRYRLRNGIVTLQGLVYNSSGGALNAATPVFQLPAGMRPRALINPTPFAADGLEIAPDGFVRVNNSIAAGAFLSLAFSFVPDQ